MDELLSDFKDESARLVNQMLEILSGVEDDFSRQAELGQYGQFADRIMGAAKSLAMAIENGKSEVELIANFTEICKAVGYQASQIQNNEQFLTVVVALLLDGTEVLDELVGGLGSEGASNLKEMLTDTFLERLKWVSQQFDRNVRTSVAIDEPEKKALNQDQINELLKKMGL